MRPKSIATVVVVLAGTAEVSSTPTDRAVMSCSVVSGGISDTDPTNVVLPAPKPPATRILSGTRSWSAANGRDPVSAGAKSIQQPPENSLARPAVALGRLGQVHDQIAGVGQVTDQDPCHPDGHSQHRTDLGHRHRLSAHVDDGPPLHLQPRALLG